MTLRELGFDSDVLVSGLTCDSREVKPNYIFAALPGTVTDGRKYIEGAIEKGAGAILSTSGLDLPIPYLASDNPRLDYAKMAAKLYAGQPKTLVAMTGTNGKSSTVEFLRQIWAFSGKKAACFGTLGVQAPKGYRPLTPSNRYWSKPCEDASIAAWVTPSAFNPERV